MNILRRRLLDPLWALLRQGLSPQELALCVALGAGIGLFPVLGISTPVLTLLALWLRLNLAAIQLISWGIGPLQLLLALPFMRLGEWVVGATPQPLTLAASMDILSQGVVHAVITLWDAMIHASIGWILVGPLGIYVLYRVLLPIFSNAAQRLKSGSAE